MGRGSERARAWALEKLAGAREWGARRLLGRLHHVTHRMPVRLGTVEKSRVLVVAPHMDDEVIGPGGTLALHRRAGSRVDVVFCAAGATAETDAVRKSEARACAEYLGFEKLHFLDFPEGHLSPHEERIARGLERVIAEVRPEIVFVPYPTDHHRDHTATALALALALRRVDFRGRIYCFEVWSPLWPNTAIDIGAVVEEKRAAIALHASQTAGLHYVDGALGLNRYRALRVYVDYAEAFWVASSSEYVALTEELFRL